MRREYYPRDEFEPLSVNTFHYPNIKKKTLTNKRITNNEQKDRIRPYYQFVTTPM